MKIIIIGGGWAGVSAAVSAKKAGGDEIHIFEKTDLLLGLGNVGGIMRNNGRYTATEEMIAMGADGIFNIIENNVLHKNIEFPGHKHADLYNVNTIEGHIKSYMVSLGIKLHMQCRVTGVEKEENRIKGIYLSDGSYEEGDVFIETTGSTGPMGNCLKYGNGCSMCILRCPAYGPRVSISACAGVEDLQGRREDNIPGAFSGSCKLSKESLSKEIRDELNEKGVVVLKVPEEDVNLGKLKSKVCQQYALKEFAENVVLLDTGHAKMMTTYYPLEKLRKIKGLENVKYIDPYAGGKGNSIRYLSVAPRGDDMLVDGIDNLFVGGEKAGLFVGHTEAIATGTLAGHNAVRYVKNVPSLKLPRETAVGDLIAFAREQMDSIVGRKNRYTFAGAIYFKRMQELGLYTIDKNEIRQKIEKLNLLGIFSKTV